MHAIISNMSDCITCWGQAEETVIKQWIHVYRDWIEFLSALNPNHIEAHVSHTFLGTYQNTGIFTYSCTLSVYEINSS